MLFNQFYLTKEKIDHIFIYSLFIKAINIIIMSKLHFIKAPCHQSSKPQGCQFAPDEIKEKYDYEINSKLFDGSVIDNSCDFNDDNDDGIKLCEGYNLLYNYIKKYTTDNPDDKIITIGGDHSISAGTIPAINEKYMRRENEDSFTSDLVVLWIDASPDIDDFATSISKDLNEMPCASILGLCDSKFTKHKLNLWKTQLIYFGLTDKEHLELLNTHEIKYFTAHKITTLNQVNPSILINTIQDIIGDKPVHVSLDMGVFHKDIVKCVHRKDNDINNLGLQIQDVEGLLLSLKTNIVSMDICEFNPLIGSNHDVGITKDLIRYLLKKIFDIKEKSINVFTEDSKFLIYRPLVQEDPESDIGWFILRGIELEKREELMHIIPDDTIISVDIDDDEYLVTKTTITEQNMVSYYTATTINDTALYPQEKACMMFELVTPVITKN